MSIVDRVIGFFVDRPMRFYAPRIPHIAVGAATAALFLYMGTSPTRYPHISDMHCIPVTVLALLAINGVIPEWVTMIYSAVYMAVDGLNMVYRLRTNTAYKGMSWFFATHHFAVLPLYLHPMIITPRCYANHASSRLLLMELANPFLNRWEASKTYSDFLRAYCMMFVFRGLYCGWFCVWIHGVVGHLNALVSICYLLWASQVGCWLLPHAPKLWKYEEEMKREADADAKAANDKQA